MMSTSHHKVPCREPRTTCGGWCGNTECLWSSCSHRHKRKAGFVFYTHTQTHWYTVFNFRHRNNNHVYIAYLMMMEDLRGGLPPGVGLFARKTSLLSNRLISCWISMNLNNKFINTTLVIQVMCEEYWPSAPGEVRLYGQLIVTAAASSAFEDYVITRLLVKHSQVSKHL